MRQLSCLPAADAGGQTVESAKEASTASGEASQKLASMGYTNVYEFGGINTWTGEIVTEETNAKEDASMWLMIGETEVSVTWEENASVEALREIVSEGTLTIRGAE